LNALKELTRWKKYFKQATKKERTNMGLDSYLKAKKYVSGYDYSNDAEKESYNSILNAVGLTQGDVSKNSPFGNIELIVAYWRKANQIHNWFVNECQDGKDECQESYVDRDQLQALVDLCKNVIETKNPKLLETRSGFFFGSTSYDECYYQDLEYCHLIINPASNQTVIVS